ncbi:unnamed protein product [Heligmosomoides polygyrus]|uniref:Site-specific DNA-methyltransferase (adenine-specific) n=1 Tax=Heligmosomoides polygyrus TaxID=6339 RepID=A0A183FCJ5_HELPZ|nr:unnamed protein product [Heligmosomoides polygyrus]
MSHGEGKNSSKDSSDFVEKFEEIIQSLFEEYGRRKNSANALTESQKNIARGLHELATSGGLKFDRL